MTILLSFVVEASIVFHTYHNLLGHSFIIGCSDCLQFTSLAYYTAVTLFKDVSPYFALFPQGESPPSGIVKVGPLEAFTDTSEPPVSLTLAGIVFDCPRVAAT